ncbi:hypothetical protein OXX69_002652 [Metschnikowia pulcherrima]
MNNPLTKYANLNAPKDLVFFNYHEYLVADYEPFQSALDDSQGGHNNASRQDRPALVINHFPNPYTAHESAVFWRTRIVRVPRIFDSCQESYMVPRFSTYVPGHEPAALTSDLREFQPAGIHENYVFGTTSLTPLVPQWVSEEEYVRIVTDINTLLFEAMSPENKMGWLDNALDYLSGTLYTTLFTRYLRPSFLKRGLHKVDEYVVELNAKLREKHHDLKLIPLLKSAMLSLDFQIPMAPVTPVVTRHKSEHIQRESQSTDSAAGEHDKEAETV